MSSPVKISRWTGHPNVGDTLTPAIFDWLGVPYEEVPLTTPGKLLGAGSLMQYACPGDSVWGSGFIAKKPLKIPVDLRVLAVRGKLSEEMLGSGPGVYGDPGLLLPLIHCPKVEKQHRMGIIPHYAEAGEPAVGAALRENNGHFISVEWPWRTFVRNVLACEEIISSSLHGIVIAEAYGIPARWLKLTDKVYGNGFKFADYYTGTGREPVFNGTPVAAPPIHNLTEIQNGLLRALKVYLASLLLA